MGIDIDINKMIGKTIIKIEEGWEGLEFHFSDGSICKIVYGEYPDGSFRKAYIEWKEK